MARKIKIEDYHKMKINDKLKIGSLIFNGVFMVCIIILIFMYTSLKSNSISRSDYDSMLQIKNNKIEALKLDSEDLKDILNGNFKFYVKEKLKFMDDNIVFKIQGFGNYYYTYDCMLKKTSGPYSYWAYNKEAAIAAGLNAGGC